MLLPRELHGFPGYLIHPDGRVWSVKYKKFLKPYITNWGYLRVELRVSGRRHHMRIHRLLALTFIDNREPKTKIEVNHIDGNKLNNSLDNLEWVSPGENLKHAFRIGLKCHVGEKHPCSKLTTAQVRQIREMADSGKVHQKQIAKIFKIGQSTVSAIKCRLLWPHVR